MCTRKHEDGNNRELGRLDNMWDSRWEEFLPTETTNSAAASNVSNGIIDIRITCLA